MAIKFTNKDGNSVIFHILEELNITNSTLIKNEIKEILEKNSFKKVIFNLENCKYIDSSGVGMLFFFHKDLKQAEIEMILESPQKSILKMFKLGRFDKVFNITNPK